MARRALNAIFQIQRKSHTQAVLIIGPGSGGNLMRTSPRVLVSMFFRTLTTTPEQRQAEREAELRSIYGSCEEALEMETHDFHRLRQVVSPEEFCRIVNAQTTEGMSWEDVIAAMENTLQTVELE